MADNKTKTGLADRRKINIDEEYELSYWTSVLGCTAKQLKKAVEDVGTSVKAVRDYLGK